MSRFSGKKLGALVIHPALMWVIILAGFAVTFITFEDERLIPSNIFTSFLLLPSLRYAWYFLGEAIVVNWQVARSVAGIQSIVQDGVYGVVRHPIYSADIVLAWGIFFFWPVTRIFICAVWLTIVVAAWARLEEYGLAKKFGAEYDNYRQRTPMLFPRLFV